MLILPAFVVLHCILHCVSKTRHPIVTIISSNLNILKILSLLESLLNLQQNSYNNTQHT